MTIVNLFIDFMNRILSFKILGFELISYLLTFTIIIFIFKVISIIGNSEKKSSKKEKSDKK